ncbi:MAG: MBL fold metallo-hydrolase [Anaerolineae bacterium]|jgi:glyoxylase-like metal-dependent hydrolase (beta-lactamase superfamily II)
MEKKQDLLKSEHFTLEQLADGVYAAIASPGGKAFSNGGIVDLGDQTLVFDAFETPAAARDLRSAAEQLTGRPVTYLIISHCHADHWGGNQAFAPETAIITTHGIRQEMPDAMGWMIDLKENPSELEQAIQETRERLETEKDERQRASLTASIARMTGWQEILPTFELRYPEQTFSGKLVFYGTRRHAELVEVAPGHTDSDAYLLLPDDRIVFMGDLGFLQCQPFMVYCDPQAWVAQLAQMEQLDVEVFVPGHGPLGTRADVALQREYITLLEELVTQSIADGLNVEETLQKTLPAPFDSWLHSSMGRWEGNVRSSYGRQGGESES